MAEQPVTVSVRPDGPYIVSGSAPLRVRSAVVSEHGEPLTWRSEEVTEQNPVYALCRCGESSRKPYCDGTHGKVGFDGTETAPADSFQERCADLGGTGIEVFDDRSICVHAGFCGNRISNVWKMTPGTDDSVVRSQVMAMIERCPSGALSYTVDGAEIEPALPVEISVITDGPLWLTGGIRVERSDGEPFEVRNRVTLCRCGHSARKPLCDGSHKKVGFTG